MRNYSKMLNSKQRIKIFNGGFDMSDERLIVALDFNKFSDVKNLINELGDDVVFYKVGMELFYSEGEKVVYWLKEQNKKVFLDLKLCDIPNTVAGGLCSLMKLGADILNVHAVGGFEMMEAGILSLRAESERLQIPCPKLIAITVLTSMDQSDWDGLGYGNIDMTQQALHLAKLAQFAGLDGVVSSPQEAKAIRQECGKDFLIVTPGIRPIGSDIDDQSRVSLPSYAIENGSNYLVVGRPIRSAENPLQAARNILEEIKNVGNV